MKDQKLFLIKLGTRVRELREEQGLTQESLAHIGNLDRTYISLIERGLRNPSFNNLCRIATALNVTVSKLLEGI